MKFQGTRIAIGITGNDISLSPERIFKLYGVEEAVPVTKPYKLVGRHGRCENTIVQVNDWRSEIKN